MIEDRVWSNRRSTWVAILPHPSTTNPYCFVAGMALIMLLLTSCSGTATSTSTPRALSVSYSGALTTENQLVAGSLLLEETDLAIDSSQASELLTLWQAFRSLSNSATTAQAEIDAVITQIGETMSAEQLEAIAAMQLTADDLAAILQQHAAPAMASAGGTSGAGQEASLGQPPGGFAVGSGPGPGGGDGMAFLAPSAGQGTILSEASTEIPARDQTTISRTGDRAALSLVDSLIALLETKLDT